MNTLGYAILSILVGKPSSGYELTSELEFIWPARHSQIYPQLSKMEEQALVVHEIIEQDGKPNKKVYTVTEQGQELLANWVHEEPSDSVVRDEFLIKNNSIWLSDHEGAERLLHDRIEKLNEKIDSQEEQLSHLEQVIEDENLGSEQLGSYMLLNRGLRLKKEEVEWCKWALNLVTLKKKQMWALGLIGLPFIEEAMGFALSIYFQGHF